MKKIDLTGQTINRLVVIREYGRTKSGKVTWLCRCLGRQGDDCGKEVVVATCNLRNGHTKSCGCLRDEKLSAMSTSMSTKHGCAYEPWYPTYIGMMMRCGHREGASEQELRLYRDRGITVCEEWRESPRAFGDWLLSHGWHKGLQIDRIDNDKGYSPDNCRVVTPKENANNRRNTVRLDDGTPLAMFCTSVGIETIEEEDKTTKQYKRIRHMWMNRHRIHPELMRALREDMSKQSCLLEMTKLKIRRAELMISAYKELLASKQTA